MSNKSISDFEDMTRKSFNTAKRERTENMVNRNGYHVQAKLPPDLYQQFWALLKAKNFSKSTGVQYAIYQLLQNEQC